MSNVFIRAEVLGENAAGQKHIHLLANNADGIHFWTDDKSIIRSIEPRCEVCEAFNKTRLLIPQPQPQRTGRWIEIGTISHSYICSVCGRMLVNITDGKNKVAEHYPFCHCGARMEDEG